MGVPAPNPAPLTPRRPPPHFPSTAYASSAPGHGGIVAMRNVSGLDLAHLHVRY